MYESTIESMTRSQGSQSTAGKHIIIEGPIGVGKSSLAKKLANTLGSSLVLEKPGENPFLARFYKSPKRHALATQLFFLFQRVKQMNAMKQPDMFAPGKIVDFMMDKDPLFAQITLDDEEYRLYQQVYHNLQLDIPVPDLVIYLQAPVQILHERIHRRKVKYEMGMDLSYLQKLSDAYTAYFHRYSESALLIVNAAEINPVDNESHYTALVRHIESIEAGKHFFNPLV
ncbi:MAG: deoxynucleoside kinase [Pseudomonadota bacterium]